MRKYKVMIKGIAPLLHDRYPEENFFGKPITGSKPPKNLSPKEECEEALYLVKGKPVIPSKLVHGAMKKAATSIKLEGKKTYKDLIRGGIFIEEEYYEMSSSESKWEIYGRPLKKNTGATIMKYSPQFNDWSVVFTINCIDERAFDEHLKEVLINAGCYYGIGGYHPRFGRFEVVKFEKQ